MAGPPERGLVRLPRTYGVLGAALADPLDVIESDPTEHLSATNQPGREVATAIPGQIQPWGVLLLVRRSLEPMTDPERDLIRVATAAVGNIIRAATSAADVAHQLQRADALRRVTSDIGSRLDLDEILERLVDHAQVLFSADRVGAFLHEDDGTRRMAASRGLSQSWIAAVSTVEGTTLGGAAMSARRPMFAVHYRDDPRVGGLRAAVVQEGFDTACLAPLLDPDRPEPLGILGVYHDEPHPWSEDELETMAALAAQATVAIKAAGNYAQLATWAAQLQSIQQLGARLNGLSSVKEIGLRSRPSSASSSTTTTCGSTGYTARTSSRWRCGPGRRVPRRDTRAAEGAVRRGDHRLGRRAPRRGAARRRRERHARPDDPGHRGRPR